LIKVLWKTCLRVFRYSPNVLLSVINHLQYGGKNKQVGNAIISTGFSKLLSSLIVHPVWDCNYRKLRAALQFTVSCRIESDHPWPARRDTFDCHALELLWERFDELEPGSVSEKLRQAIALTPFEEEFPAFLLTISQHVSQKATDGDFNPAYRGLLAYPVEMRDLRSIEQALDNYAWEDGAWRISTQRIWEAFKLERGMNRTEFPKDREIEEYIPLAIRHIYGYIVRAGVSPIPSPGVGAEGTDERQVSSQDGDADHDSWGSHDQEHPAEGHIPSLGAISSSAPDTDGDSSDDGVPPTMSGAINSSSHQRSADNELIMAGFREPMAGVEALEEQVQALGRPREVDPPTNEALMAENERLRRQRNTLRAQVRRQAREIQLLLQQRT
jgi:hypothetical protein